MTVHVFAGYTYYPCGGASDHVNTFDTKEEAIEWVKTTDYYGKYAHDCWWHICDAASLEILEENA